MQNTERVKTHDGAEAENGDVVWFMHNDIPATANLIIGYHDKLYKIYKSRSALIKRYNVKLILTEVRCILKESMRTPDRMAYLCTFDGKQQRVNTKSFQFNLVDKEDLVKIQSHLNLDEIQELTIKYL